MNIKHFLSKMRIPINISDGNKISLLPRRYSLLLWLSICFFSFSVIIIVLLVMFQLLFFNSFYKAAKLKNITDCETIIHKNIKENNIYRLIDQLSRGNEIDIILFVRESQGEFLRDYTSIVTEENYIEELEKDRRNVYFDTAQSKGGSYIITEKTVHSSDYDLLDNDVSIKGFGVKRREIIEEHLIYVSSFTAENGDDYLMLLESVVTPRQNTQLTLLYQLRIIMIIVSVLSIFITYKFARLLAKPITDLTNSAKELAVGNYDVEFKVDGYREAQQLAEALNYATSELRQLDQMRKDLIANVSHDLRTPLTLITGYGEVMRDIPGENTPENIQIIIDEATRLTSLVNDLIDLSKIEAGTMKLDASVFCITETIRTMFGRYNKLKEQDGFIFTLEQDQDVYVYADELKISQVIYNLVNNAVNYAGDNREITVRQICYDNRVRIEVMDNGPGIPQDKLKNIWDRYYKVDKSHKSAKIGTGLGLSIVKTVLKLHNAQFGVFSKVGKGSVFWFELHRTDENGKAL
ncbi:MAG: HAMP domain-containing protein [Clostridia bacterium]|nr:HAMP domain-containing protein [Clostridia bacterium]